MKHDTARFKSESSVIAKSKTAESAVHRHDKDKPSTHQMVLDKLGIWISSLCALHCLMLPLLIPILPLLASSILADAMFERAILMFSILLGFIALLSGFFRYHRQVYPLYSLVLGGFTYWNKDILGHHYEPAMITLGAVFIIAAHVLNLRLCRKCKSC